MTNTDTQDTAATAERIPASDRSIAVRQAQQILTGERGLKLTNYDEMYRFAKAVADSKFKPVADWSVVDCFICLQKGAEVGMTPMQSLESIYVVNNRATLFGDAPKGLIEGSGLMIDYDQYEAGKPFDDDFKYVVMSHRKGRSKPLITTYSVADAKVAKLWGKAGAWTTAPKRMLMFRARGFNLRDNFSDVLKGFTIGELIDDESLAGFEHAKPASAKVVEPNFGPQPKFGPVGPTIDVPRRRGRPPKNPLAPEPAANPIAPPAEPPEKEEPRKEEPGKAIPPKPEPIPHEPETAEPTAVKTGQSSLFSEPIQSGREPVLEVVHRLRAAKIPQEKFLALLLDYGYLNCDLGEITMGHFGIGDVEKKDLELALKNWPEIIKQLGAGRAL
jgi:hypothetical protein